MAGVNIRRGSVLLDLGLVRAIRPLWIALLLLLPAVAQAQFTFTTNNGAITITGYTGLGGDVVIPSTTNGYPVTSIAGFAFFRAHSLSSVTIPDSVTNLGSAAFADCAALGSILVDTNNPVYSSLDGVVFNKNQTVIIAYPPGLGGGYVIPQSTTGIADSAFFDAYYLTDVTIPDGITSIGSSAFYFCIRLNSIAVPDSVTSIGDYAFGNCWNLATVAIGNGATSIGTFAFYKCSGLTSIIVDTNNPSFSSVAGVLLDQSQTTLITCPGGLNAYSIPNGVTVIGNWAFYYCSSLTNVKIPNSVINIGDHAFYGCTGLSSVTIPDSVNNIGVEAFYNCTGLINVAIGNSVTNIGNYAFHYCTNMINVMIPNGNSIMGIGNYAFQGCSKLTRVMIPGSVTKIGSNAFIGCRNLTKAFFSGNAPSGDNTIFDHGFGTVYDLPGTTGWGSTFGGWPTALWYQPNPMILGSAYGLGGTTNGFGFNISWATNLPVVVEACTNLASPVWNPVATNTLTGGSSYFGDPQWTNYAGRFYRLRSP